MTVDPVFQAPVRRSPLQDRAGDLRTASRPGIVTLRERAHLRQFALRVPADARELRRACEVVLGTPLPERAGIASGDARRSILWLGPDEWLVVDAPQDGVGDGSKEAAGPLLAGLEAVLAGHHAAVVDVSANRTVIEVAGPAARDLLEGGCRLDLHPRAFGAGSCAATNVARAGVYLHQLDELPTYRLFVRASFAGYLADWLIDASNEAADRVDEPSVTILGL